MPPKRKGGRKQHPKTSTSATTPAVSDPSATPMLPSKIPLNIIVMVLKRVPVKSILHFKCASKPWLSLLSSHKFISMHLQETSKDQQNHCFLIHSVNEQYFHTMCMLNINSTDKEPVSFINPFPNLYLQMDLVGSINGLVCLSCPPLGRMITLWNPAMMLYKCIRLSKKGLFKAGEVIEKISLGFAYDSVNDDYKVIRIASLKPKSSCPDALSRTRAEVYSLKLDSWKRVPMDFPFSVYSTRNNAIAKGIPYWVGKIYEGTTQFEFSEVLLWYDIRHGSFKHAPLPEFDRHYGTGAVVVEWKGNLGLIVDSARGVTDRFVHILVYDEKAICWKKVSTLGPIAFKIERIIQCSKDGVILGETPEGKLFLFDPVTNGIKVFSVPKALKLSFDAFSYAESLVSSKSFDSFFT